MNSDPKISLADRLDHYLYHRPLVSRLEAVWILPFQPRGWRALWYILTGGGKRPV